MRAERSSTRPASLAATATTLLALLAMTSTASAAATPRAADMQSRSTVSESHMVRAMAAVVAAAARDLLVGDQHTTPIIAGPLLSLFEFDQSTSPVRRARDVAVFVLSVTLGERLLDLPPPRC
ncbi:MAG: hypothetical protein V3U29_10140 [Phycisphaeraceae bacterium]